MWRTRGWWILILAIWIWWLPVPIWAQDGTGDRTVFGQSYTLPAGQRLKGNLSVFGGSATLEERSEVNGNVVVTGGSLTVAGRVQGDIAVLGGSLSLLRTAYVDGDVVVMGGSITQAEGAIVTGEIVTGLTLGRSVPFPLRPPRLPEMPDLTAQVSGPDLLVRAFLQVLGAFLLAALMAALALVVLSMAPHATRRVGDTILASPALTLVTGLVTLVLGLGLVLLMAITICLIPAAFLLLIALLLAMVFGWIVLGWLLGDRLLRALSIKEPHPLLSGVIGVALITLIARLPCLGFVLFVVGASIGLGAVVLTRAGTQPYHPRLPAGPSSAAPPVSTDQTPETPASPVATAGQEPGLSGAASEEDETPIR